MGTTPAPDPPALDLPALLARLSLEQKVRLLTGADFWSLYAMPEIGLRRMVVSDGPAGVRGESWDERDTSANVPSPTALAATWDTERVAAIGRLLAAEARRKGVDVLLAPTVNLQRTPYGGRHFECYSEDPLLTARIGAAYVTGLQSAGVGACVKHFICNDSETERMTVDVRIDDRTLHELYLAPFETIVREAGVWSVMASYNSVNGSTMTESPLLRQILHEQWGFDGVVISDWTAARSTVPAALAALDLAMPGPATQFGAWGDALLTAVREGKVDEALIDDKVTRILRLAARTGALAGSPPRQAEPSPEPPYPRTKVAGELRRAASASFVLCRNNNNLLPLDPGPDARLKIAVIGHNAAVARTMGGGSATVFPPYTVSPLDGLRAAGLDVGYAPGVYPHERMSDARAPWLSRPDGSGPGTELRYYDADGALLGVEQRGGASFLWLTGFGAGFPRPVARLEARCVITATEAGVYQVGAAALGRFRLLAGDTLLLAVEQGVPDGSDMVEAFMSPPQHVRQVALAAGESVAILFDYDVMTNPLAGFATAFQLVLEEPHGSDDEEIAKAAALAAACDVAVVVVGTSAWTESEGTDRATLVLPGRQDDLVRAVAAACPRVVAVVNSGAPVLLPWADQVDAVVLTWFGGQEYGGALADVILGQAEPGGRLPVTWPATETGLPSPRPSDGALRYEEGLRIGYRAAGRDTLYPFGHGTGYTTWSYQGMDVQPPGTVAVTLTNTGRRAGREVVQVYASRPVSAVDRPVRWLAGFAIAAAAPGETVTVSVPLASRALMHWTPDGWRTEPGTFVLAAGHSSAELPLRANLVAGV